MYSLSTLIITGFVCLLAGGALGALALYVFRQQLLGQSIEQQLHQAQSELQAYQRSVAEHFSQTSTLVNNLTQAYREVHEHLANGALKLATPAISRQILDSANTGATGSTQAYISEQQIEPPRDWAPKTPGSKGALSEDYDLHDEHERTPRVATESADDYDFDGKANRY
ncbi:YhcB family protein [Cellvibrio japonicus]|uniref:Z-ring associated protein G n=1 Tax=Cellvibrio japonicus (strain Ueda107) TaxID=498211 RepID=B3PBM4_CELJU|nr:DUF1043 family protein [Cellvibrio japonicus]ACE84404.1 conserved hypothetical protein [Cellvibrio japonicus Ueda107]QEI13137.1 DUF1043 family protein [Cellvibrio japonicus]QEI16711.1 DUF1043 family protein [Cellvibrio japonicus]QEI20289.1 DUF1043 family protein [Cellvibrio japonicus]